MSLRTNKLVLLFDMIRHGSHLVFRYISTHPDVQDLWHPVLPAWLLGPERVTLRTKNQGRDDEEWAPPSGNNTYAEGGFKFQQAVEEARAQGKTVVANGHTQMVLNQDILLALLRGEIKTIPAWVSNPTVIPSYIFNNLTPVFIIRNPIFAVPSNYIGVTQTTTIRADEGEDWRALTGMPIQRQLFDYFRERNNGKAPLVIDGDDVMWRTNELRDNLAQALDLDPQGFSSKWETVPPEKRHEHPVVRHFLTTINDSAGIERSSEHPPDANLEKAHEGWVERWGKEVADQLQVTVQRNVPHYEYMKQFTI